MEWRICASNWADKIVFRLLEYEEFLHYFAFLVEYDLAKGLRQRQDNIPTN